MTKKGGNGRNLDNIWKKEKLEMMERRKKSRQKMKNVGKVKTLLKYEISGWTEILLKHGKCWKDGNLTEMRKMLKRRKSY